jgi:YbgC/YbaW family acyl-CoA thioester hydrolase
MRQIIKRKIMWGDLDSLGIVFYPRYYEWVDACTHLFFESLDLRFDALWKKRKLLFGLVETSSQYNSPGRYHESIEIITEIERLNSKTVVFKHTIVRESSDTVMLTVREKRICMDVTDPENIRAIDIPSDLYSVLKDNIAGGR